MNKQSKVDEHVKNICDDQGGLKAQVALDELSTYFLGDHWYTEFGETNEQCNPYIVRAIELRYNGYEYYFRCKVFWYKVAMWIITILVTLAISAGIIFVSKLFIEDMKLRSTTQCICCTMVGSVAGHILFNRIDSTENKWMKQHGIKTKRRT